MTGPHQTSKRLSLTLGVVETIQRSARHRYPEESCGLLIGACLSDGRTHVLRAVELSNAAVGEARRNRYEIPPRELLEWERRATREHLSIIGFFHSHPDHPPKPSQTDAALAWPAYVYVIVGVVGGTSSNDPLVTGMAAWTFDEPSTSFRELTIDVQIGAEEIEYYI